MVTVWISLCLAGLRLPQPTTQTKPAGTMARFLGEMLFHLGYGLLFSVWSLTGNFLQEEKLMLKSDLFLTFVLFKNKDKKRSYQKRPISLLSISKSFQQNSHRKTSLALHFLWGHMHNTCYGYVLAFLTFLCQPVVIFLLLFTCISFHSIKQCPHLCIWIQPQKSLLFYLIYLQQCISLCSWQ